MLISAKQLNQLIENPSPHLCIFDCRYALPTQTQSSALSYGETCYRKSHIPGAQFVNLDKALSGKITAHSGRHPLPEKSVFQSQLQHWGLNNNSQVIIYDDNGGMFAARLWWMLHHWAGINQVSLLDGGFPAWQKNHYITTNDVPHIQPSKYLFDFNDDTHVTMQEIQQQVKMEKKDWITDARSFTRYQGMPNPIDTAFGHIPGAVSLPCQQNINEEGYFLPPAKLKARFESLHQINQPNGLIHSCGSGVTACHNAFAMELAGYNHFKIYVGSWSQWTSFSNNPIEKSI